MTTHVAGSHSLRVVDTERVAELVVVTPTPSGLSLSAQPTEDVWIAQGLSSGYRVVSEFRQFGQWAELADAVAFIELLVAGNPNLRRIA